MDISELYFTEESAVCICIVHVYILINSGRARVSVPIIQNISPIMVNQLQFFEVVESILGLVHNLW